MDNYLIISFGDKLFSSDDFENVNFLKLGNGKYYYITKNNIPFLTVEVDLTFNPFDDAVIFGDFLCIGVADKVYFININSMDYTETEVDLYFGYFYIIADILLILSGTKVYSYNNKLIKMWETEEIAIDGICVHDVKGNGILEISCELDPPGGWVTKYLELFSGKVTVL